jgi:cbb3-type cytochrome oxidase maturation protein
VSVIWVLVGFSILVALGFLIAFIWAVRSGQYDDRYTPSVRMLFEDEKKQPIQTKEEGSVHNGNAEHKVR